MLSYQALYHALSMNYVTIAKLQNKLDKEANQSTVRKLIDKMIREGYVEAKGSRRLGQCCLIKNLLGIILEDRLTAIYFLLICLNFTQENE